MIPKAQCLPINPALISIPEYDMHLNFDPMLHNLGASGIRGVGIYTAVGLKVTNFKPMSAFLDHLWVSIKLKGGDKLVVGCVYRSPSSDQTLVEQMCNLLCEISDTQPSHLVIMGDFNFPEIDWEDGSIETSSAHHAHMFLESIRDCFLYQHVRSPTRYRHGTNPNVLDLILTHEESMIKNLTYCAGLGSSDHLMLQFNIECYSEKEDTVTPKLALNKADTKKMLHLFCQVDWNVVEFADTLSFYRFFSNQLTSIIHECVPLQKQGTRKRNIYMTHSAMSLKRKKERLWRNMWLSQI